MKKESSRNGGIGCLGVIQIVLIILKLFSLISISWWLVFIPLYIMVVFWIFVISIMVAALVAKRL